MILSATANVTLGENRTKNIKNKTKRTTTYFMQAADVTGREKLQRFLGKVFNRI